MVLLPLVVTSSILALLPLDLTRRASWEDTIALKLTSHYFFLFALYECLAMPLSTAHRCPIWPSVVLYAGSP